MNQNIKRQHRRHFSLTALGNGSNALVDADEARRSKEAVSAGFKPLRQRRGSACHPLLLTIQKWPQSPDEPMASILAQMVKDAFIVACSLRVFRAHEACAIGIYGLLLLIKFNLISLA